MAKYYVEIPHEAEKISCIRAIKILKETGSHFLTHAEYGCMDGDHTARIIVEMDTKDDVLRVIPPAYRHKTRIVKLTSFSNEELEELLRHHTGD